MKKITLLAIIIIPALSWGQITHIAPANTNSSEKEILDVVLHLFEGMREGDSSKVHSVFRENPELYTSFTNKEGKPVLRKDDGLDGFLKAIGTPHEQIWDEPIWNIKISIDDNLASVWTDYAFYAGKNFSHCGVDAFMLNKDSDGWKIYHLTDTRRREGCDIPAKIKKGREL